MAKKTKILIIRFSSFGDIVQCLSVVSGLQKQFPQAEIHWVCRQEFVPIVELHPNIHRIWSLSRKDGFQGLWTLGNQLRAEQFTHVYDAHQSLRSHWLLGQLRWLHRPRVVVRSKNRWKRFLFFRFRIPCLPQPFYGMKSFQEPLQKWGVSDFTNSPSSWNFPKSLQEKMDAMIQAHFHDSPFIVLAPSAAWPMKRWPIKHWQTLIQQMPELFFAILGGPQDVFCADIANVSSSRAISFAGDVSLLESCYLVARAQAVVSGDTGILHVADLFQKSGVALIGPTAFGFPTSPTIQTLTMNLPCQPCSKDGRGKCRRTIYQECLEMISPDQVSAFLK